MADMEHNQVWYGVVEDREDPLQRGRVRVRIFGYHSPLKSDIPTEDLPWSDIVVPASIGINSGVGASPTGAPPGTWVMGIWKQDGEGYQLPLVMFAIPGNIPAAAGEAGNVDYLQQELKQSTHVENYGDGFKDVRTEEQLKNAPTNKLDKREYPDGKDKKGDEHGAQLKNGTAEKFPRTKSNNCVNYSDGTMSDMSIIATNNEKHIEKTIVGQKRNSRESGGLLDDDIKIASIDMKTFKCGVTNESGTNKGTNKSLGAGNNAVECSWLPSTYENYAANKEAPTNSNGDLVYKEPSK